MQKSLLAAAIQGDEKALRDALLPAADVDILRKSLQQCARRRIQPEMILPASSVIMMMAASLVIGWLTQSTAGLTVPPLLGLVALRSMRQRLRFFDPVPCAILQEWKTALSPTTLETIELLRTRQSRVGGMLIVDLEGMVRLQPAVEDLVQAAEKTRASWMDKFLPARQR